MPSSELNIILTWSWFSNTKRCLPYFANVSRGIRFFRKTIEWQVVRANTISAWEPSNLIFDIFLERELCVKGGHHLGHCHFLHDYIADIKFVNVAHWSLNQMRIPLRPINFVIVRLDAIICVYFEWWTSALGSDQYGAFLLAMWEHQFPRWPYLFSNLILRTVSILGKASNRMLEYLISEFICA